MGLTRDTLRRPTIYNTGYHDTFLSILPAPEPYTIATVGTGSENQENALSIPRLFILKEPVLLQS